MKKRVRKKSNYGAIKLIEVKNNIKCYTKESVEKKIEGMQNRIDFLMGQNTRLRRNDKELKNWKKILRGLSRYTINNLIEEKYGKN